MLSVIIAIISHGKFEHTSVVVFTIQFFSVYVANEHIWDEHIDTVAPAATLFLCKSLQ